MNSITLQPQPQPQAFDASGYAVFSAGSLGQLHAHAHRFLDEGQPEQGRRFLGRGLADFERHHERFDQDRWTHIQWHQMVFELQTGHLGEAYRRFKQWIEHPSLHSAAALTDGPSAYWRLQMLDPRLSLSWRSLADHLAPQLEQELEPYREAHVLLALCGAGRVRRLRQWNEKAGQACPVVLRLLGQGLLALVEGEFELAQTRLFEAHADIGSIGGSRAQNELFYDLALFAVEQSGPRSRAA